MPRAFYHQLLAGAPIVATASMEGMRCRQYRSTPRLCPIIMRGA
jgi:hypothetical protein